MVLFFVIMMIVPVKAQEVQWRGPYRDGKYPDKGLLKEWPEGGPELLLKKEEGLGGGYSTPVYYDGIIYVTGRRDTLEVLTALTMDGAVLWETVVGKAWMKSFQETRNTPAIEDGRIYITATMGTVNCIDAKTGDVIWARNTHDEFGGEFHRWGMAESVVLTENAVISSPAGDKTTLVALDKEDGTVLWQSKPAGGVRSYASPLLIEHNGQQMIIASTSQHLVGVNPATGEIFWKFDHVTDLTKKTEESVPIPRFIITARSFFLAVMTTWH